MDISVLQPSSFVWYVDISLDVQKFILGYFFRYLLLLSVLTYLLKNMGFYMKRFIYLFLTIFVLAFLLVNCNRRNSTAPDEEIPDSVRIDVPAFGSDNSLEIVTWNVENFPKLGTQTVDDIAEIVTELDADIYGMEEIADTTSFRQLINKLDGYAGTYSSDQYGPGNYQKTAVLYKKNIVSISNKEMLFTNDDYIFPRPPLKVYVTAQKGAEVFDFTFIVLHLKAYGDAESEARRRSACVKLKSYLDGELVTSADKDYVVVGDWNDELTDPPADNVFQVFLDDPTDYRFLTLDLPSGDYTYIGGSFRSNIDQILITADAEVEYDSGTTSVIKIDQYFNAYVNEVSDHRPVGSVFPVFQ